MQAIDGNTLRAWRNKRLMTQQDLAEKAGLRIETICRLELNKRPARFSTVYRIAQALEISTEQLLISEPQQVKSTISIGGER